MDKPNALIPTATIICTGFWAMAIIIAEVKATGEIVAMGVLEALKNTLGQYVGYLDNWATKSGYIGKHVGRILADRAIQMLKSWGCETVRINLSYKVPEKLIKVFGKAGFEPKLIVLEKRFEEEP